MRQVFNTRKYETTGRDGSVVPFVKKRKSKLIIVSKIMKTM